MRSRILWITASVGVGVALFTARLASTQSPAPEPIVLHYSEAPIFMGPHEHPVNAVAFSADGKSLATGGDGCLRIWDCATGRLRSVHARDESRGIGVIHFMPDGKLVAVAGGQFANDAVLWDTTTGRIAREIDQAPSSQPPPFIYKGKPINYPPPSGMAVSPDGRILATSGEGVVVRDASSGSILATLKQPAKNVKAIAFSPDGKTLASVAEDKKLRLWRVPEWTLEATLDDATQPLTALAISPDGRRVVAAGSGKRSLFDQTLASYLWCWERPGGAARKIELGSVQLHQIAFVDPTTIVFGAGRELLSLDLNGDSASHPRVVWLHSGDVLGVAVSPDRRLVACGSKDRTVDIIELSSGKLVHRLPGLADNVSWVAASSDGKRFATATIDYRFSNRALSPDPSFTARYKDYFSGGTNAGRMQPGQVRIWSTADGCLESLLPLPTSQVTAVRFIPAGNQIAVAGWKPGQGGMLSLWDLDSVKHVRDFAVEQAEVTSISISADGRTLASGDAGGNLELWDVASGNKVRSHKHDHPLEAVAFSADGKLLATGDAKRTVQLFDAASGKSMRTLNSRSNIESLDFSPDGHLLAAGTLDPGFELWDLRAGAASRTFKVDADHFATMPGYVAFSPDGRFVVCGGHGKDVAVFDALKAELHCELRGHFHASTAAVFLPDGRLITGGEERTVRLWDIPTRKNLAIWIAMPADEKQGWSDQWVGFKPAGAYVGSANLDRLVGWESEGETFAKEEGARHRVKSLFEK